MKHTIPCLIVLVLTAILLAACSQKTEPAKEADPTITISEPQSENILHIVPLDEQTCEIQGCLADPEILNVPEVIGSYTVVGIGSAGLANLNNTRQIILPDTVEYIGWNAFANDTALEQISLGNGLKRIGEYAFNMCSSLETVRFPEGMTTFEGYAFGLCDSLAEVYIPASVTDINIGPFQPDLYRDQITIVTPVGSAADQFARDNNLAVRHSA